jgi:hypothetical protein
VSGAKRAGVLERAVGGDADDVDLLAVLSSEPLDPAGLRVAHHSERGPDPHENRLIAWGQGREVERRSVEVTDLGMGKAGGSATGATRRNPGREGEPEHAHRDQSEESHHLDRG